jgi:hypothetical protein
LLKTIACYGVVFEGLTDEALAEFVQTTAMNAPGYEQYCRHQQEIRVRSLVWARAAQKYWWALGSNPKRTRTTSNQISLNQRRAEDAQRRIREAVDRLVAIGQFPVDATGRVRVLIREARTSQQTLYRYPELWHPEHREDDRTGCVTADAVGDAAGSGEEIAQEPESLEFKQDGALHTLEERMKGGKGVDGNPLIEIPVNEATSATVIEFNQLGRENDQSIEKCLEKSLRVIEVKLPDRERNQWIEKLLEKSLSTFELIQNVTRLSTFHYSLLLMHNSSLKITLGNRKYYIEVNRYRTD